MLRIIQNRSTASAQSYYTKADYYSEGQELAGRWGGKAAAQLGLAGEINQWDFDALCENKQPGSGERLTPRTKDDRTVGYDFNFHVPKGVSLAYMLNRDERILHAFRDSVHETMQEIEADTKTRIRLRGRDDERVTGNLAWGEFIHFTARPVDGVPDPHLHAHCFVFNSTFDAQENRWKAAQFRDIKRDAPYFQAAYYARFAQRLQELGYPIVRRGKQWDLAAVPKSLSQKFSRRTTQVEKYAQEFGVHDAQDKDALGAKTREKKQKELSMPELRALWRERLSPDEAAMLAKLTTYHEALFAPSPDAAERAVEHAIQHCFERNSVIPQRELLAEALTVGIGEVGVEEVVQQLPNQGVIVRELEGRNMATTRVVLAEEQAMLAFAREGRKQSTPLNPDWKIKKEWLNEGQQAAVRHVLESSDRVMMIKGIAGTGKTSLMQEAVEGINAGGHSVFTFAPSAEASRNVLRSEGFASATTVAELIANPELQQSAKGQVLWIDEAGLLGTRQLKQVFDIAQNIDARVILSGDWKQHSAVERGAAMRLLEQEGGIRPAVVQAIQRQKGLYRAAVSFLAKGETLTGFDLLDEMGWIREIDHENRPGTIAQEYANLLAADGKAPLVVSPTHAEGDAVTAAIRQELKYRDLLGSEEHSYVRLVPLNLTAAERADPAMIEPGNVIVFQQNAPGHKKGERIVITNKLPADLPKYAERFQVYQLAELSLAQGDPIRFTSNGKTKDGKHRLNNGAIHRIAGFTKGGDIRLDNGWIVAAQHGFIAPGYVVTSHAAQGKTYQKVLIAESSASFAAAGQEQFYVSVSRGKQQAIIFTDDKAQLKEAVTRSAPRISATELLKQPKINRGIMQRIVARLQRRARQLHLPAIQPPERSAYGYQQSQHPQSAR